MRRVVVPVLMVGLLAPAVNSPALAVDRAQVSATVTVRADERVQVTISSDGRRVLVRFQVARARKVVQRSVHAGVASAVLPTGARHVSVRALATQRLASSRWVPATKQPTAPIDPPAASPLFGDGSADVTQAQLERTSATRVLFGHQSVGANILDGMSGLFAGRGATVPAVVEWPATHSPGGFLSHAYIGENGDPMGKIADFADRVRETADIDVAVMKLCFVDVVDGTDAAAVFRRYRDTMAALRSERPDVKLIYATVPLTVGASRDNAVRQRFNALVREQYAAGGNLFDIAALESTRPDGSRVTGGGGAYLTLHPDYASDDGHLNDRGAQRVAAGFARAIASAG